MRSREDYLDEIMHLEDEACRVLRNKPVHEGLLELLNKKISRLTKEMSELDASYVPKHELSEL